VISSNLHSCHGVIQSFRAHISSDLSIPFADIMFPEEKLSCVVGREIRFLLAVDKGGAMGCCIMASSTEPLRTEILFMHALKEEKDVIGTLLGNVLSFLGSRRAPDVEAKWVESVHSPIFKETLNYLGFSEKQKVRMLLGTKKMEKLPKSKESRFRVRSTDSLLMWRAVLISAISGKPIDESRKQVHSETPVGTIEEDELTRLIGYADESPVGTLGYSTCTTIGYLDSLSAQPGRSDRTEMMEKLLRDAIGRLVRKRCEYVVIDVDKTNVPIDLLEGIGFHSVGSVSYFSKTITPKRQSTLETKDGNVP